MKPQQMLNEREIHKMKNLEGSGEKEVNLESVRTRDMCTHKNQNTVVRYKLTEPQAHKHAFCCLTPKL